MAEIDKYRRLISTPDLKPIDKLIYLDLKLRQGRNSHSWPTIETIADDVGGVSTRTVQRSIQNLEDKGWLSVQRPDQQGRGKQNNYAVKTPQKGDTTDTLYPQKGDNRVAKRVTTVSSAIYRRNIKRNIAQNALFENFDLFWKAYPKRNNRKVGKKACRAWWKKNKPEQQTIDRMVRWLELDAQARNSAKESGGWYPNPKDPIRWLKGEGWEDEIADISTEQLPPLEVGSDGLTPRDRIMAQQRQ